MSAASRSRAQIKVVVIEDEPEILRRFADAIASEPEFCLAGAVGSGAEAISLLTQLVPDVVLIDLGLPDMDGVDLIRRIKQAGDIDVLVVTMFGDDQHVLSSIRAGACGYLLKDGDTRAIVAGIRQVRAGGAAITPTIARKILTQFQGTLARLYVPDSAPPEPPAAADAPALSPREIEILRLISKGLSIDEVSTNLQVSKHTVVAHVKRIYRKLAVHSRSEAIYEANQLGLL